MLVFVLSFSLQITFWFLSLHAMFNSLNIAVVFKIIFKMQITYSAMEVWFFIGPFCSKAVVGREKLWHCSVIELFGTLGRSCPTLFHRGWNWGGKRLNDLAHACYWQSPEVESAPVDLKPMFFFLTLKFFTLLKNNMELLAAFTQSPQMIVSCKL